MDEFLGRALSIPAAPMAALAAMAASTTSAAMAALAAAGLPEEMRPGMAGRALLVPLAAADPRRLRQTFVRLASLALGRLGGEWLVAVNANRRLDEALD